MTFRGTSLLLLVVGIIVLVIGLVWLVNANELLSRALEGGFNRCWTGGFEPNGSGGTRIKVVRCPSRVFPLTLTIVGGATALVGLVSLMFSLNRDEKTTRAQ